MSMMFWWACSTENQKAGDAILLSDDEGEQPVPEDEHEDEQHWKHRKSQSRGEMSHPSAPSDERNEGWPSSTLDRAAKKASQQQQQQQQLATSATAPTTPTTQPQNASSSRSDDISPVPAEPPALVATLSALFPTECVRECAEANELEEDDSFIAVFENPHYMAMHGGHNMMMMEQQEQLQQQQEAAAALARTTTGDHKAAPLQARSMKGMTICVHAPRQVLPPGGYEIQWQVDPPEFTGLYRVQATVVREIVQRQVACSETGQPIEIHQDGERVQVARLTAYRFRPRILRQQWNTAWQKKYPAVHTFLNAVPEESDIWSLDQHQQHPPYYYHRHNMIHSVSQVLMEDLYVHPDFRGGGLGLSLLHHASRKVGDALACTILGLPAQTAAREALRNNIPHDEDVHGNDYLPPPPQDATLTEYFGLLGYVPIHERYLARPLCSRPLLEEACPKAPNLEPDSLTMLTTS